MLDGEVLIRESAAIDGLSSSTVVIGEISSLSHEVGDDTMEVRVFVSKSLFPCTECSEVGSSFRSFFIEQLED